MGDSDRQFGELCLRTAWLFQAVAALPTLLWLGALSYSSLFNWYEVNWWLYDFIANFLNTLFAASIVFIVLVQRKVERPSKLLTLQFETAKSTLATVMWIWLVLDRAFGPWASYHGRGKAPAVIRALITSVLLLVLFYPTAIYANWAYKKEKAGGIAQADVESGEADERTGLLQGE